MHFWIDKRSQGCGFSGRHLVPPSFSGYGRNHRFLCAGFHPKPMVTPVHRFQSIESVANNGLRHTRSPGYHQSRLTTSNNQPTVHYNGSTSNIRNLPVEIINTSPPTTGNAASVTTTNLQPTPTPRRTSSPTAKIKCGVWIFFAIVTFFLAAAKYYFHGVNIGMEAFAFCSLLVIILIIGGLVSLYEAITSASANGQPTDILDRLHSTNQNELDESQVPNLLPPNNTTAELPPPPYHIAIMLPSQNDPPPPSYDKAVT